MIVTVTGKAGSGKSLASKVFASKGFKLIDADRIGHDVLEYPDVKKNIVSVFGENVLNEDKIDRKILGDIVFNDKNKLKELNKIVHPVICKEIMNSVSSPGNFVIDAALFYELNLVDITDIIVLVTAPREMVYKRLSKKYSKEIIDNIYKSQKLPKNYDYLIENDFHDKNRFMSIVNSIIKEMAE